MHAHMCSRDVLYVDVSEYAQVRECVCVFVHVRVHGFVLVNSLLHCLCTLLFPITLLGRRRTAGEGRGELLAVTQVPKTSSGPVRHAAVEADVCVLSASSDSYRSLQLSECY